MTDPATTPDVPDTLADAPAGVGGLSLHLNPAWPWWLVAATGVGLVGLVLWLYPPRVRHLPPRTRRTLIGLRLAGAVLLVLCLLRPEVRRESTETDEPAVLVLADVSRSMTVQDAPGGASRFEQMAGVLESAGGPLADLGGEGRTAFGLFDVARKPPAEAPDGDGPRPGLPEEPDGDRTGIGSTLEQVVRESDNVSAIILLTDGAQRTTPPDDADPRTAAKKLAEAGVRVFGVPFGSDGAPTAGLDLAVADMRVDPVVFEKKQVPVEATVRAVGGAGREFVARLLIEDRTGASPAGWSPPPRPATPAPSSASPPPPATRRSRSTSPSSRTPPGRSSSPWRSRRWTGN